MGHSVATFWHMLTELQDKHYLASYWTEVDLAQARWQVQRGPEDPAAGRWWNGSSLRDSWIPCQPQGKPQDSPISTGDGRSGDHPIRWQALARG